MFQNHDFFWELFGDLRLGAIDTTHNPTTTTLSIKETAGPRMYDDHHLSLSALCVQSKKETPTHCWPAIMEEQSWRYG
jgi:hypothetical protein